MRLMYQFEMIDSYILAAAEAKDKEVLTNLIKAKNAMVLANVIRHSADNVKLGWRGKCEALSLADIKVEF